MRATLRFTLFVILIAVPAMSATPLLVSTDWASSHLRSPRVQFVFVGDSATYEAGHIPGSLFVAANDLVVDREHSPNDLPDAASLAATLSRAGLDNASTIILYGREVIPAARAFVTLDYAGVTHLALLDGGLAKWIAEGRPTESGASRATASAFQIEPRTRVITRTETMKTLVDSNATLTSHLAIIDSRSPAQYSGAETGEGVARAGHIPGAINIPWEKNLTTAPAPTFRSIEELREMYRSAGVGDEATIVTYCRTGMQSSVTYFVLRLLGRDVHLYDGSAIDWTAHGGDVMK